MPLVFLTVLVTGAAAAGIALQDDSEKDRQRILNTIQDAGLDPSTCEITRWSDETYGFLCTG